MLNQVRFWTIKNLVLNITLRFSIFQIMIAIYDREIHSLLYSNIYIKLDSKLTQSIQLNSYHVGPTQHLSTLFHNFHLVFYFSFNVFFSSLFFFLFFFLKIFVGLVGLHISTNFTRQLAKSTIFYLPFNLIHENKDMKIFLSNFIFLYSIMHINNFLGSTNYSHMWLSMHCHIFCRYEGEYQLNYKVSLISFNNVVYMCLLELFSNITIKTKKFTNIVKYTDRH